MKSLLVVVTALAVTGWAAGTAAAAVGIDVTTSLDVGAAPERQVRDVGIDASGRRYVLMGPHGTVAVFAASGGKLAEWSAPNTGEATAGYGNMAVAPDGTVYLSAPQALRAFDSSGRLLRDFGPPPPSLGGWAGPLVVEAAGTLLVSDRGVSRYSADGRRLAWLAGYSGVVMAAAPDGGYWTSRGNGVVEGFDASGAPRFRFGGGEMNIEGDGSFGTMRGLAVDGAGRLWVAAGGNHQVFSAAGRLISVCERQAPRRLAIRGVEAVEGEFSTATAGRIRATSAGCRRPRQPIDRVSVVRRGDHVRIRYRGLRRAQMVVRISRLSREGCDAAASAACSSEEGAARRRLKWRRGAQTVRIPLRPLGSGRYLVQMHAVDARDNRYDTPLKRMTMR